MRKRIPIGIDDFEKLISGNYLFVDKSLFIKAVYQAEAEVLLIPRPRRFGKTLNMSMVKHFFTVEEADKNRELFQGLLIEKEQSLMKKQGKVPVIYLSFKDVKELSWEDMYNKVQILIKNLFREHIYVTETMDELRKKDYINLASGKAYPSEYENSLQFLSQILHKYHRARPIVLIDEYDQPIISAYMNGFFKEGISFFRNLYSAVLKSNPHLEKGVLTGILRFARESIFSGLNNLWVDSILKNDFNYFGFSEHEVQTMLCQFGLEYDMDQVRTWYNGYTFGNDLVYNPWSIISFIKQHELVSYWVNTSDNALIKELLSKISQPNYEKLLALLQGEPIEVVLQENISFEKLDSETSIWNLMLFSGYLSLTKDKKLRFVNREVTEFYKNAFEELAGYDITAFYALLKCLLTGDIQKFQENLKRIFYTAVSYYDVGTEEKYYHNLMLGLAFGLEEHYLVKSNREYGTGRVDLLLQSKTGKHPDYIFEFKVSKNPEALEADARAALKQIVEKQYSLELQNPVKIGMSFWGKQMALLVEE